MSSTFGFDRSFQRSVNLRPCVKILDTLVSLG
jgi:hypothetical protein